jgi:hypothetical protein
MKDKYADQDDEEREMRLQLIGAKKVKGFENKNKNFKKSVLKEEEEEEPQVTEPDQETE